MRTGMFGRIGSGRKTLMEALMGPEGEPIPVGRKSITTLQVRDERIDKLSAIFKPKRTIYSTVEMVLDDHPSDSLKDSLNALRQYEVLVYVAKGFDTTPDAILADVSEARDEMILGDLMLVEKRLESFKKTGDNTSQERLLMDRLKAVLEDNRFVSEVELDEGERRLLVPYNLLTLKDLVIALNVGEDLLGSSDLGKLEQDIATLGTTCVSLCAKLEAEIAKLSPEEQAEMLSSLGIQKGAGQLLIQALYKAMNLISFFTVGEDEVRAWPVRAGSVAPVAAGKVHSDIQRGFIRAETCHYDDFMKAGSLGAAKGKGTLRLEGKEYLVKDGDIINFLFKV